jgi:predicted nucleic acid-binding protein
MILLDTNVVSEMMRPEPAASVVAWVRRRSIDDLATTTINIAEIRYGLARLEPGHRRTDLEARFNDFILRGFANRVFDFDGQAAEVYGELVVGRERAGRRLEGFDGLIAAIARSRSMSVATRNTTDFAGCGIEVLSPWGEEPPIGRQRGR